MKTQKIIEMAAERGIYVTHIARIKKHGTYSHLAVTVINEGRDTTIALATPLRAAAKEAVSLLIYKYNIMFTIKE